ncbi:MC family transporter: phosphate [Ochromonadaceae sp. CCMP2298]|nr:MC family transporter: phosphate [Ochromonadaceae sp. CCMP2298]
MAALSASETRVLATSAEKKYEKKYDFNYFLKSAVSGGLCCAITHGSLTPLDVVKTRIQLDPTFNKGLIGGFKHIVAAEGMGGLFTGLGPTVVGYGIQGWFKFGGVEFFKIQFATTLGDQRTWENQTAIYLASAAMAEFIADIFLCPLEATRIRLVSQPSYAPGLVSGASRLLAEEGLLRGFYSGFGPILLKQVPYTMAKFSVQGEAEVRIAGSMGKTVGELQGATKLAVATGSGVIAGVAAGIVSHPADTLLSKVNKAGAGGTGSIMTRLGRIAAEIGFVKLCTVGLGARCVMVGTLTAAQFLLFDVMMDITGAEKFHFRPPAEVH